MTGVGSTTYNFPSFVLTHDAGFTSAQKVITYSLVTSTGDSISSISWLSFNAATSSVVISSLNNALYGEYNFILKGSLADPINTTWLVPIRFSFWNKLLSLQFLRHHLFLAQKTFSSKL